MCRLGKLNSLADENAVYHTPLAMTRLARIMHHPRPYQEPFGAPGPVFLIREPVSPLRLGPY